MKSLKNKILTELSSRIEKEMNAAKEAFSSTSNFATDQEFKAESKWDTRSIEAGYLAGAQKKRVEELEGELELLKEIDLSLDNNSACIGSLVNIELNKNEKLYFISSTSGGSLLNIEGNPILVISAFSPIGKEVIGTEKGEDFAVETTSGTRNYNVKEIW